MGICETMPCLFGPTAFESQAAPADAPQCVDHRAGHWEDKIKAGWVFLTSYYKATSPLTSGTATKLSDPWQGFRLRCSCASSMSGLCGGSDKAYTLASLEVAPRHRAVCESPWSPWCVGELEPSQWCARPRNLECEAAGVGTAASGGLRVSFVDAIRQHLGLTTMS